MADALCGQQHAGPSVHDPGDLPEHACLTDAGEGDLAAAVDLLAVTEVGADLDLESPTRGQQPRPRVGHNLSRCFFVSSFPFLFLRLMLGV